MKILTLEKELHNAKFTDVLLKEEAEHVWQLQQMGIILEIYFTANTHEAVIIFEAEFPHAIEELIKEFPLVTAGCIEFQLIPLAPYDGLERLFAE
jgi:muconolactone delta-isomerase